MGFDAMGLLAEYARLNFYRYVGIISLYLEDPPPNVEMKALAPFPFYEGYRFLRGDFKLLDSLKHSLQAATQRLPIGFIPTED